MVLVEPALDDPEVARVRAEEEIRDRADPGDGAEQEIDADIAAHPRDMPFRHAEVARLPDDPQAHRGGDDVARHRDHVEDHVEADAIAGAWYGEGALEQFLHRLDPLPHRGGIGADRQPIGDAFELALVYRHQGSSAINVTAGCRANGFGRKPVSRCDTRDQRTGAVRGMNGTSPVSIRSAAASCAWRSAVAGARRAASSALSASASQIALASQVKWRRYQLATLVGATSSMSSRSAGAPIATRSASMPIMRQSRRR